jgi:hypothetical protein
MKLTNLLCPADLSSASNSELVLMFFRQSFSLAVTLILSLLAWHWWILVLLAFLAWLSGSFCYHGWQELERRLDSDS